MTIYNALKSLNVSKPVASFINKGYEGLSYPLLSDFTEGEGRYYFENILTKTLMVSEGEYPAWASHAPLTKAAIAPLEAILKSL